MVLYPLASKDRKLDSKLLKRLVTEYKMMSRKKEQTPSCQAFWKETTESILKITILPKNKEIIVRQLLPLKFKYSEKATNFCYFSYVVMVKSKVEILQNYVAFLEYMNFKGKKWRTIIYCLRFIHLSSEVQFILYFWVG